LATFDTLLKIASRFSSAVVRDTHDLLLAKSVSQEFDRSQLRLSGSCRTSIVRLADFAIGTTFGDDIGSDASVRSPHQSY
jgi:hypothetical protein